MKLWICKGCMIECEWVDDSNTITPHCCQFDPVKVKWVECEPRAIRSVEDVKQKERV